MSNHSMPGEPVSRCEAREDRSGKLSVSRTTWNEKEIEREIKREGERVRERERGGGRERESERE